MVGQKQEYMEGGGATGRFQTSGNWDKSHALYSVQNSPNAHIKKKRAKNGRNFNKKRAKNFVKKKTVTFNLNFKLRPSGSP